MKPEIHPEWYPNAEVIYDGEVIMTVGATQPRIVVDVWSGTHPFYTGQQRLLDTEGQVDRFMRRLQRRASIDADAAAKKTKRDPRKLTIDAFSIGQRGEKGLRQANLTTVGDVLDLYEEGGDDAILALPSLGQTALIGIKRYLRAEGLIE